MKKIALFLCLAACGDNLVPAGTVKPDGGRGKDFGDELGDDLEEEDGLDLEPGDFFDPVTPDCPDDPCEDKHILLNGHHHKCQH